jgi:hypothetical protein
MTKQLRRHDDDDDDVSILKDGERMRIPLRMMDSLQRDVAQHFARVTDGRGDSALGLHKSGYHLNDAARRDLSVYDQYDAAAAAAWQGTPTGFSSGELVGQREGDTMDKTYIAYDSELAEAWRNQR